jgi:anti-sigma28 factor (negative regulator of flagellin synthesis)
MHIHGTSHIHGPHGINAPHSMHRGQASQNTPASAAVDRLDISAAADAAAQAAETSNVRQDLVNTIRAQIAAGTYDTPAKLDAALERMFDETA